MLIYLLQREVFSSNLVRKVRDDLHEDLAL